MNKRLTFKSIMNILTRTSDRTVIQFYQLYRGPLLCYIFCRIRDFEEAEDMVQDIFVRLLTYEMKLDEKTVKSFLFTIARNMVIDYFRHFYTKKEKLSYLYDEMETTTARCADVEALYHETMRIYQSGKQQLSPKTRMVYELSFERDMSIDEISRNLSITYNTVECHLFLARRKVRNFVKRALVV